jgi:hypothetical protein
MIDAYVEIRSVNGYGPRCGCGGRSKIHLADREGPKASIFLCAECVLQALTAFMLARPDQPPFWPGDRDRDEAYQAPALEGKRS